MTAISLLLVILASPSHAQQSATVQSFAQYVDRQWPSGPEQQGITCRAFELMVDAMANLATQNRVSTKEATRSATRFQETTQEYCRHKEDAGSQPKRLRRALRAGGDLVRTVAETADASGTAPVARLNAIDRAASSFDEDSRPGRQGAVLERFFRHSAATLRWLDELPQPRH